MSNFANSSLLLIGISSGIAGFIDYFSSGYSQIVPFLWLASLVFTGVYFLRTDHHFPLSRHIPLPDFLLLAFLLVVFSTLYLTSVYTIPWQVNTDEILVTGLIKNSGVTPSLLGLSSYSQYPSFIFVVLRHLTTLVGGPNLLTVRLFHALSGLAIILLTYVFFRSFTTRPIALGGATLMGSQHALLAISRMALRDNIGLLLLLSALSLFLTSVKRNSVFAAFVGGAVSGLTFYNYFSGQITFILWVVFLFSLAIFFRKNVQITALVKLAGVSLLAFLLVVSPYMVSVIKVVNLGPAYYRTNSLLFRKLLIFPEGRLEQQLSTRSKNELEAVKINISRALTAFNNTVVDQGRIYPNPGHGFVDPLSGILVWFGLLLVLFKRQKGEEDYLATSALLFLLFTFGFIINAAPHYTRLLVTLPFVYYYVVLALKYLCVKVAVILPRTNWPADQALFFAGIFAITLWNLTMFKDFVDRGLREGNDYGGSGRYVETRKDSPNYTFYVAMNAAYPFFTWGNEWISPLVGQSQKVVVLEPTDIATAFPAPKSFTIFLNREAWQDFGYSVQSLYPKLTIHNIKPDGSLLAVEVI